MKKIKTLFSILFLLLVAAIAIFKIPGDIAPSTTAGIKLPPLPETSKEVEIFLLRTSEFETPEQFTIAQGSLFRGFEMVHGAVLVKHGDDSFLFDTGLGRQVDKQFSEDMPFWLKPLMAYGKVTPAADQIENSENMPAPKRIFLSHSHWDHASGLVDFPDSDIWVTYPEREYMKSASPPDVFPSQVGSPKLKWHEFALSDNNYAGFSRSYDIYGDGAAVLVDLSGHTPGSLGLFVNSSDGVRRFFVGDAVWDLDSAKTLRTKFWLSSRIVDNDRAGTNFVIAKIAAMMKANPELKVIPAHDRSAWQ